MKITKKTILMGTLMMILATSSVYAAISGDLTLTGTSHTSDNVKYYKDKITVDYSAEADDGIKTIVLSIDGKNIDSKEVSGQTSQDGTFEISKEWLNTNETANYKHEGKLTITDQNDENETKNFEFFADTTSPEVAFSGITDELCYKDSKTLTCEISDGVIENTAVTVKLTKNGEEIAAPDITTDKQKNKKKFTFTASDDGKYVVKVTASDIAENKTEKEITFTKDTKEPKIGEVKITGEKKEGAGWFCDSVKVNAPANDELSGLKNIKLYVDDKLLSTETESPLDYEITKSWLKNNDTKSGKHTVKIVAEDNAGNTINKEDDFRADVEAPDIAYSGVTEGAFLNTSPAITVTAADAHATDCKIVFKVYFNGEITYSETKEGDSLSYTPEDSGSYKLEAYAADAAGNKSETKSLSFMIDKIIPDTMFSEFAGHKKSGFDWFDEGAGITIKASDNLSGLKTAKVTVNGKTFINESDLEGAASKEFTVTVDKDWIKENKSADGSYKIEATTVDRAGNTSYGYNTFYADVTIPEVALSGIKNGEFTNKTPDITCDVNDDYAELNTIYMTVTKDGKAWKDITSTGKSKTIDCFTKDGKYVITAYSVDKAGNKSEEQKLSFVKDTVAPSVTLSGAKAGSYTKGAKNLKVRIQELNYEGVTTSGNIVKVLEKKRENISWGKISPDSTDYTYTKKVSKTGTYTATISATDKAGNKSPEKKLTFTIDNEAPIVKIFGVSNVNGYSAKVTPGASYEDPYFANKKVSLTRPGSKSAAGLGMHESKTQNGGKLTYSDFKKQRKYDGSYTFTITVTDKAGNKTTKSQSFIVNRFGSTFKLSESGKDVNKQYVKGIKQPIKVIENNPTALTKTAGNVRLDGQLLDRKAKANSRMNAGGTVCTYTFDAGMFNKEGVYTIETSSIDQCKNLSAFNDNNSCTFTVDKTAPIVNISGIEDKGRYKIEDAKMKLSIVDNAKASILTVTSDGKSIFFDDTGKSNAQINLPAGIGQEIIVTAVDSAGNKTIKTLTGITVSDNLLVRLITNKVFDIVLALIIAGCAALIILAKRRKKTEEDNPQQA